MKEKDRDWGAIGAWIYFGCMVLIFVIWLFD